MTCVIYVYVCLGTPAGYVSAMIYKSEFTITMMVVMMMMMMMMMMTTRWLFVSCNTVSDLQR